MECGYIHDAGETALCIAHAAKIAEVSRFTMYNRVKKELWHQSGATRLDCDLKWKSHCLIPMGVVLRELEH